MQYVKDMWHDDVNFVVVLQGPDWNVWYAFSLEDLAAGAPLRGMMTEKIRRTLIGPGWRIDADSLKEAARQAIDRLRPEIEYYFDHLPLAPTDEEQLCPTV